MDFKEAQALLRKGVAPDPNYPDLPDDTTAAELIAFDPNAELQYRLAKDQNPELTRAMILQNQKSFRIGQWLNRRTGGPAQGALERLKKRK